MQQNILRLDVPMHDVLSVCIVQCRRYFPGDPQGFIKWELPFAVHVFA
jgi:hypothetical protein